MPDPVNEPGAAIDGRSVDRRGRGGLVPILALALALRVLLPVASILYTQDPRVFRAPDTESYVVIAESLLRAGRFGIDSTPDITRTPGYPILLLAGVGLGRIETVTLALQIALSLATVCLVYALAEALTRRRKVATWAALLYALEPLSVIYASKLLSETLFTAVLLAGAYGLALYARRPTLARAAIVALALAAAAYVRPVAYFLPIVVAACLIGVGVRGRHQRRLRQTLGHAVVILVIAMGLTGLWRVRNWAEADYRGFSAIEDVNTYFYLGASVRAAREGVPYYEMQRRMGYYDPGLYLRLHPEQTTWSPAQRSTYQGQEGRRAVLSAPLTYARIHVDGIVRMLIAPGATDLLGLFKLDAGIAGYLGIFVDQGLWRGVTMLSSNLPLIFWSNLLLAPALVAYLLLAAIGVWPRARRGEPVTILMLGLVVYLVVIAGGPAAYARFRHPVMPIVCVFAACGVERLRRGRRGGPPVTTSAGNVRAPEIGGA